MYVFAYTVYSVLPPTYYYLLSCIFFSHGYAHYLHTKVFVPLKVKYLWEDVVCKYWPWAISKQHLFEMGTMKACLPVMHAKAHSWHCQVL